MGEGELQARLVGEGMRKRLRVEEKERAKRERGGKRGAGEGTGDSTMLEKKDLQ